MSAWRALLCSVAVPPLAWAVMGITTAANAATSERAVKPAILQASWFWETAAEQANPPVPPPVPPPKEPSGVPDGDLAVAHTSSDGASSKMSVVAFDLSGLPADATIVTFTVSLTVDSSSGATNIDAANAPILACLPTRLWPQAQGGDYTDEPPVDCTSKASPRVKGDRYSYTISTIAQSWTTGNVGVAFVNDPTNTSAPFQAVFKGAKSIEATMTYSPPAKETPIAGASSSPSGGSSGGAALTGSGGIPTGSGSSQSLPLPPSGPTTDALGNDTGQAPVVASPNPTTGAEAAVPAVLARTAPSSPPVTFWLAAFGLLAVVAAGALVLGSPDVPVPNATTSKLSRVLRDRERMVSGAQVPPSRPPVQPA